MYKKKEKNYKKQLKTLLNSEDYKKFMELKELVSKINWHQ